MHSHPIGYDVMYSLATLGVKGKKITAKDAKITAKDAKDAKRRG